MNRLVPFIDASAGNPAVRGFLHEPETAAGNGLVLTHGAGSNCQAPLLVALAHAFCGAGWLVLRCDLPFRQERSQGPPPRGSAERDQAGLRAAVDALKHQARGHVFLGGHSYGGRQASMLAAREPGLVNALLLLSYPLHPPQRPDALRTEHFPELHTPTLFVHGSADGFGSIAEIRTAIGLIPGRVEFIEVAGAGHELMTGKNRTVLPGEIAGRFSAFAAG